ncbi:hypothetical protein L484_014736 [Morus notabilis]|uniref:Uncharacterized protein n=1 Tax=Morus notabilis TaxID=981085 RepID=W9QEV2_9ROSA|nr:hypothetical protein L484_014736 [Morus notabilis]
MPSTNSNPSPDQPMEPIDIDLLQDDLATLPPNPLQFINNLKKHVASLECDLQNVRQSRDAWYSEYHILRHQNDDMAQEMESMNAQLIKNGVLEA